ncbi:hypothetical protein R6Q59_032299 [Mikania micrantha]
MKTQVGCWMKITPIYAFSYRDLMELTNSMRGDKVWKKPVQSIISISCWCLWRARNELVHNDKKINPENSSGGNKILIFSMGYEQIKHIEFKVGGLGCF